MVFSGLSKDGRARPMLTVGTVEKLECCRGLLGLADGCDVTRVIEKLADACMREPRESDADVKRRRGSVGGAERELWTETALAGLGWDVTALKHQDLPILDIDLQKVLTSLPDPLRQLILLFPETPRSLSDISRGAVIALVTAGMRAYDLARREALSLELAVVDDLGTDFFGSLTGGGTLMELSGAFARACPLLRQLFSELAIGPYTAANTRRTEEVKMECMLLIASAIGKVRNVRHCGFSAALYVLWKSLGVPVVAINVLAGLGLSVSAKDGAAKMQVEVSSERDKLARQLMRAGAAENACIVFDNIDYLLGTRSFVKSEVDVRSRLIHVTAASVVFFRDPAPALSLGPRPLVLPIALLFADSKCQYRLTASIYGVLHEVLHAYGQKFIGCGKMEAPLPHVHFGSLLRSRRHAFPIYWLEEGKVDDMYQFVKNVMEKFRAGSCVHFVGDCFSLQKLLAVRELLYGENLAQRADPEDCGVILVPGWFHLYWNVFLGSLLHSDRDLLAQLLEIADLKNLKLNKDIGTCFNDIDHLVKVLLPVVIVRLFKFFRETVAVELKLNFAKMSEIAVMERFTSFITGTVEGLGSDKRHGVLAEWQRYCRVALLLCVYRSLRVAIATENHAHMVDVLYFSVTLVCQGSFKQYRKVILEAVAHFARSSDAERDRFVKSFTGNYSGGHLGGRAMDEIREFDNKAVKEALRRNHRSEGDLAPELELTERHREISRVFAAAFPVLDESSGGAIPTLPVCETVEKIVMRAQWPSMTQELAEKVAKRQTSFFDSCAHLLIVKDTLEALYRGHQFK